MRTAIKGCFVVLAGLALQATSVRAITVTDGNVAATPDTCTLAQAIYAANVANGVSNARMQSQSSAGNCAGAGSGSNAIVFDAALAGTTLTFTDADNFWFGSNALPPIASPIAIDGGAAGITLRITNPLRLRFFFVGAETSGNVYQQLESPGPGSLTLTNLTLSGGIARGGDGDRGGAGAGLGGAIFNQGGLLLLGVTLSENQALGGAVTGLNASQGGGGMGADGGVTDGGGFGARVTSFSGNFSIPITVRGIGGGNGGFGGWGLGGNGDGGDGGGVSDQSVNCRGGGGGGFGGYGGVGCFSAGNGGQFSDGGQGAADGLTGTPPFQSGREGNGGGGGGVGGGGGRGGGGAYAGYFAAGGQAGGGGFGGGGGGGGTGARTPTIVGGIGGGGGSGGFGGGGGSGGDSNNLSPSGGGGGGFGGGDGGGRGGGAVGWGGAGAGMGGAIFNHRGSVVLVNVTATGNAALGGTGSGTSNGSGLGAVLFNLNGSAAVAFSTLSGNQVAHDNGRQAASGAIYSLAYGNRVEDGTASDAGLTISQSIVTATTDPSANDAPAPDVVNAEVDGTATTNPGNAATLTFAGANLVGGVGSFGPATRSGSGTVYGTIATSGVWSNGAADLGALADHGGPTWTMRPNAGSAAIDGATSCAEANGFTVNIDQRGVARPQGDQCDIGALEVRGPRVTVDVTTLGGSVSLASPASLGGGGIADCSAADSSHCTTRVSGEAGAPDVVLSYGVLDGYHLDVLTSTCNATSSVSPLAIRIDALAADDCTVQVGFALAPPQFALAIAGHRDFARYGEVVSYQVTLANDGGPATGIAAHFTLSAGFDAAHAQITCQGAGSGANCTQDANDPLGYAVDLPANRSLIWNVSVPVRADTPDPVVAFSFAAGAASVSDQRTLVLFRDGFELP